MACQSSSCSGKGVARACLLPIGGQGLPWGQLFIPDSFLMAPGPENGPSEADPRGPSLSPDVAFSATWAPGCLDNFLGASFSSRVDF